MKLSETIWVLNTVLHGGQEGSCKETTAEHIGPLVSALLKVTGKIPGKKKPEYHDSNL